MPIDPTPYAAFGVMGGLLFAVVVLTALLWRLFARQSDMFEKRDQVLMDFVNDHRKESSASLDNIANKVAKSQEDLGATLSLSLGEIKTVMSQLSRRMGDFMLTSTVLTKVDQMRRKGDSLDETVIEKVVRSVLSDQQNRER